eukprot:jgi/Psemu1/291420/fgenesh1_pg.696_\
MVLPSPMATTKLVVIVVVGVTSLASLSAVPPAHALRFDVGLPGLGNISYRDGLLRIRPASPSPQGSEQEQNKNKKQGPASSWTVPETAFWGPVASASGGGIDATTTTTTTTAMIEHRPTDTKGYGAFYAGANHDLPRGTFLGLYEGRLVRSRDALDRLHASRRAEGNNTGGVADYVLSLDGGVHFLDGYEYRSGCNVLRKLVYVPDDWQGDNDDDDDDNDTRLDVEAWFRESYPRNLPRVAFFAARDICPGEELCFDYGTNFWKDKEQPKQKE